METNHGCYTLENQASIPSPFNKTIPAFFQAWDNPNSKDEDWINFLSPECVLKFGGSVSQGHDTARAMRSGFINPAKGPVVDLQHTLKTCWVLAGGSNIGTESFIIKSSIWYLLSNGRKVDAECTTYIKMADNGEGSWHAIEYEVFMSSFEFSDAIKEMFAALETKT